MNKFHKIKQTPISIHNTNNGFDYPKPRANYANGISTTTTILVQKNNFKGYISTTYNILFKEEINKDRTYYSAVNIRLSENSKKLNLYSNLTMLSDEQIKELFDNQELKMAELSDICRLATLLNEQPNLDRAKKILIQRGIFSTTIDSTYLH
jgi:hypothetical protein